MAITPRQPYPLSVIGGAITLIPQNPASIPVVSVQGLTASVGASAGGMVTFDNFENGFGTWSSNPGAPVVVNISQAWSHSGSSSMKWVGNGFIRNTASVSGAGVYQFSCWLYSPLGSIVRMSTLQVNTRTFGDQPVPFNITLPAGVPVYVSFSNAMPASMNSYSVFFAYVSGSQTVYIDDFIATRLSSTTPQVYIGTNFQPQFPFAMDSPWPLPVIGQASRLIPQNPARIPGVFVQGMTATVGISAGTPLSYNNFETSTGNWGAGNGGSIALSSVWSNTGSNSLQYKNNGITGGTTAALTDATTVPGTYQFSAVIFSQQTCNVTYKVQFHQGNQFLTFAKAISLQANTPTPISVSAFTASAGIVSVAGIVASSSAGQQTIYIDDAIITRLGVLGAGTGTYITSNFQPQFPFSNITPYPLNIIHRVRPQRSGPAAGSARFVLGNSAIVNVTAFSGSTAVSSSAVQQWKVKLMKQQAGKLYSNIRYNPR